MVFNLKKEIFLEELALLSSRSVGSSCLGGPCKWAGWVTRAHMHQAHRAVAVPARQVSYTHSSHLLHAAPGREHLEGREVSATLLFSFISWSYPGSFPSLLQASAHRHTYTHAHTHSAHTTHR